MTSLVLQVLPFAVAVVGFVFAVCCTAAIAVDLILHTEKTDPRACERRVHDPRR